MLVKILRYQYIPPVEQVLDDTDEFNSGTNLENDQEGALLDENKTYYELTLNSQTLTLHVSTPWKNIRFEDTIVLDLTDKQEVAYEIMLRESNKPGELSIYPIFDYVDRTTRLKNVQYSGKKIARIVLDSNIIWVYLAIPCDEVSGFENELIDNSQSSTGILLSKCNWLKTHYSKLSTKANLINTIDSNRSLAYLEAQVDILTRILISLAPESNLLQILKLADTYSVLNIKPLADISNEFSHNKSKLRDRQEIYYEHITNNTSD